MSVPDLADAAVAVSLDPWQLLVAMGAVGGGCTLAALCVLWRRRRRWREEVIPALAPNSIAINLSWTREASAVISPTLAAYRSAKAATLVEPRLISVASSHASLGFAGLAPPGGTRPALPRFASTAARVAPAPAPAPPDSEGLTL